MYCPKCGTLNPDDVQTCNDCGVALTEPSKELESKTSGLAVGSLIMGILSAFTCFITALPAIICGIVALVKIGRSRGQLKGTGLAVMGIALPAIIAPFVIGFLAALLMPALTQVKYLAQRTVCSKNMQCLSVATMVYMNGYEDKFPTTDKWCDLLIKYADVSERSFRCPLDPEGSFSYAFNKNLDGLTADVRADVVMIFEARPGRNTAGGPELLISNRHPSKNNSSFGGCNIIYVDGHVEFVNADDIDDLKWTP